MAEEGEHCCAVVSRKCVVEGVEVIILKFREELIVEGSLEVMKLVVF